MASADSHHTNLDAAESLLLLAGWQPQALQHHIQSSNADAAGRRARPPTQFISTTCQICSAVPQVSLTDSIVAESASAPAVSSLGWADSKRQVVKPTITIIPVDIQFFTSSTPETKNSRANIECVLVLFKISWTGDSETEYFVDSTTLATLELASRLTAFADATNLFNALQNSVIGPNRAISRLPLELVTWIFQIEYRARIYDSAALYKNVDASSRSAREVAESLRPPDEFLPEGECGGDRLHWAVHWEKILRHCVPAQSGLVEFDKEPRLRDAGEEV